jgi:hypothetical protein
VYSSLLTAAQRKKKKVHEVQKMVLGVRNPRSIACEARSLCFPGFFCKSLIISSLYVILFLLFTNDVTICMELDPGIHIGSTWFVLETGCDTKQALSSFCVNEWYCNSVLG